MKLSTRGTTIAGKPDTAVSSMSAMSFALSPLAGRPALRFYGVVIFLVVELVVAALRALSLGSAGWPGWWWSGSSHVRLRCFHGVVDGDAPRPCSGFHRANNDAAGVTLCVGVLAVLTL